MNPTSIVVDLRSIRCGSCKVALHDELATVCPVCGAPFDSISSNHVGLADKLKRRRAAAGAASCESIVHGADYVLPELVSS
jgi:hypothetical protein